MPTGLSLLSEAELHGLVDGHVEVDRRADVLRRLAASPSDRALLEAWQEQNDLIRSAFRDVDRETLPVALDLAPPLLRCIEGDAYRPLRAPRKRADTRRNGLAAAATLAVVATGLVGSWLMITQAARDGGAVPQPTLESTLADRASAALDAAEPAAHAAGASAPGLPTVRLPDLTNTGLTLTSVSSEAAEPASLVLQYRDDGDGRVVVSVSRTAQDAAPTTPSPVGKGLAWRRHKAAFALAGTLPPDKLRAIAAALQADAGQD